MTFSNFINFGGNCREAVTFYATVFDQEVPCFLNYGEMNTSFDPNVKVSEKGKSLVADTCLTIAGTVVRFSDMPDNFELVRGNSIALSVSYDTVEEAREVFYRLSKGGQVFVPFAEIPGQGYYGMVGDPFDISWMVSAKK